VYVGRSCVLGTHPRSIINALPVINVPLFVTSYHSTYFVVLSLCATHSAGCRRVVVGAPAREMEHG
jgi:hypothetical protein